MVAELNRRFSGKNVELMQAIQSCSPQSPEFLNPEKLIPLTDTYNLDSKSLSIECVLAKRTLDKSVSSIYEVFVEVLSFKASFPTFTEYSYNCCKHSFM